MRFDIKLSTAFAVTALALTGLPGLSSAQDA